MREQLHNNNQLYYFLQASKHLQYISLTNCLLICKKLNVELSTFIILLERRWLNE